MLMPCELSANFLGLLSSCSDEFSVKGGSNGVKGRLRSSLNFWVEALDASDFGLTWLGVVTVYLLPSIPHSAF